MLHANLVSVFLQLQNSATQQLRAATPSSALPSTLPSTPQASQAIAQLSAGQTVTASIVSRLAEGVYLANLDGNPIQLALAAPAAAGESLSLRVLRTQPELVFKLLSRSGSVASSASAGRGVPQRGTELGPQQGLKLGPQPGPQLRPVSGPAAHPASAPQATLSQGAQIIQLALGEPHLRAQPFTLTGPLPAPAPLLAAAPQASVPAQPATAQPPIAQLAAALRTTLEHSGLFYESHVAAWAQGQRPLAELRREPQAQWHADAEAAAGPAGGRNTDAVAAGHAGHSPARDAATDAFRAGAGGDPARTAPATLPEEARLMLRQQLDTLETRQVAWQGPLWPGQQAKLTIAEDAKSSGAIADAPTWRTALDLSLPQLGGIHAELTACGDTLRIAISAPERDSASLLQTELHALDERLRSAGLKPVSLRVTKDA